MRREDEESKRENRRPTEAKTKTQTTLLVDLGWRKTATVEVQQEARTTNEQTLGPATTRRNERSREMDCRTDANANVRGDMTIDEIEAEVWSGRGEDVVLTSGRSESSAPIELRKRHIRRLMQHNTQVHDTVLIALCECCLPRNRGRVLVLGTEFIQ